MVLSGASDGHDEGALAAGLATSSEASHEELPDLLSGSLALHARLLEAQSTLGHAIAVFEGDRIVHVNRALEDLLGLTRHALRDRASLFARLDAPLRARVREVLEQPGSAPRHAHAVVVGQGGRRVPVKLSSLRLDDKGPARSLVLLLPLGHGHAKLDRFSRHRLGFVAEASEVLSQLHGDDRCLDAVAALAVPRFADWCVIETLRGDGALEVAASVHVHTDGQRLARELLAAGRHGGARLASGCGGAARLVRDVESAIVDPNTVDADLMQLYFALGVRSAVVAPMTVAGRVVGVIRFFGLDANSPFSLTDLDAARDLACRVAVTVDYARLLRDNDEVAAARDALLETTAHELNTPLSALLLQLEAMRHALTRGETGRLDERLERVLRQLKHLAALSADMLEGEAATKRPLRLRRRLVSLETVLLRVTERLGARFFDARRELAVGTSAFIEGWWDPARLESALEALVCEAMDSSPSGPVELDAFPKGHDAHLVIRHASPVRSAPERTSTRATFLAHRIVHAHGGSIRVDRLEGSSTTTVRLPRA